MEDLKTMMDTLSIEDINQQVKQFVHSAEGHGNRVKLTFVLLNLIQEGTQSLRSINLDDFISEVKERVEEMDKQAFSLAKSYNEHVKQNDEITRLLADTNDNRIVDIQSQIEKLLSEYDGIIRRLVEVRDKMPIEKQMEKEKR